MKLHAHMNGETWWNHNARTEDQEEAVRRAIEQKYGKNCFFHKNQELSDDGRWIGQVFKNLPEPGFSATSETGQFAIDFK